MTNQDQNPSPPLFTPDWARDLYGEVIDRYGEYERAVDEGRLFMPASAPTSKNIAREAGFVVPVYVSALVNKLATPPKSNRTQSWEGRMWDVLWMAFVRIKMDKSGGNPLHYKLRLGRKNEILTIHSGPGDNMEHVITIVHHSEELRGILYPEQDDAPEGGAK